MSEEFYYSAASQWLRNAGFETIRRPSGVLMARAEDGHETELNSTAGVFSQTEVQALVEARDRRVALAILPARLEAEQEAAKAAQVEQAILASCYVLTGAVAALCKAKGLTIHASACLAAREAIEEVLHCGDDKPIDAFEGTSTDEKE